MAEHNGLVVAMGLGAGNRGEHRDERRQPSPPAGRSASRRRRAPQIIEAAARVFAERGFHGATTQDIADVLGIRQASLYYYFSSKEAALETGLPEGRGGLLRGGQGHRRRPRHSAREALSLLINSHLSPIVDRGDFVKVFLNERQFLPTASRRRIGRWSRGLERIFEDVIRRASPTANFAADLDAAPGDARHSRHVQCGIELVSQGKRGRSSASAAAFAELVIDGLGKRPQRAPAQVKRAAADSMTIEFEIRLSYRISQRKRANRAQRMTAGVTVDRETACAARPRRSCCASGRARARIRSPSAPSISASIASGAGATMPRWSRARRARLARSASNAGERVAIMGDVCEEWMICDLAAQSLGAIVYGIYPTASAGRGRIPDARRRRRVLHRRGSGIRRQDSAARRSAARSAHDRGGRRFRDVRLRASQAARASTSCWRRGGRARSRLAGSAGRDAVARRSRLHRLHLRHDRPSQGRAGHARQASRRHRHRGRRIIRRCARSRTAPSSICRCATCSAATSRSRCR